MAVSAPLSLRPCEIRLIEWIRAHAVPYGTAGAHIQVEYQDKAPVMIRVTSQVTVEEKLR